MPRRAGINSAAAFRFALRRFLSRTEVVAADAGPTPQRYDLLLAIKAGQDETAPASEVLATARTRATRLGQSERGADQQNPQRAGQHKAPHDR